MTAVTSADHERQDQEVDVGRVALGEPEEELVLRVDLHVELGGEDEGHDHEQQQRERRRAAARQPSPAQQDAEADAQEAGHQQEVAEEADVADVGRDPADEQQLHEQERRAGQEEPDARVGQRLDPEEDLTRARQGADRGRRHQAVEVAASARPTDSSQRSASMAARQPSPAAVTA